MINNIFQWGKIPRLDHWESRKAFPFLLLYISILAPNLLKNNTP
jgi:hypothetical protein